MTVFYDKFAEYRREALVSTDIDGNINGVSENFQKILGCYDYEIIGNNISNEIEKIIKNQDKRVVSGKFKKSDGKIITLNAQVCATEEGYILSIIDITKYTENDKLNEEISEIFDNSKDIVYKIQAKPEFKKIYLSPSIEEILGYPRKEHYENPNLLMEIMHPDDIKYMQDKINGLIDYSEPSIGRYRHKDGHYVWLEDSCTPIYDQFGEIVEFQGVSRDITARKKIEEELERRSVSDSLTGVYNKRFLKQEIKKLNKEKELSLGAFFCDLDNLKEINDSLGHEKGDNVIIAFSKILKKNFKEHSLICRVGGDEFIVLIKNTAKGHMERLAFELRKAIECENNNGPNKIEVSIGYYYSDNINGDVNRVINKADEDMYKKKNKRKTSN